MGGKEDSREKKKEEERVTFRTSGNGLPSSPVLKKKTGQLAVTHNCAYRGGCHKATGEPSKKKGHPFHRKCSGIRGATLTEEKGGCRT